MMENLSKKNVILCGGASQPDLHALEELRTSMDNYCLVGVDRGSLVLIEAGYRLNYAIGDFDSVSGDELSRIEAHSQHVMAYPPEKDDTDMELALKVLLQREGPCHFYIFGGIGRVLSRLDHLIANLWLIHQPRFHQILTDIEFVEKHHYIRFYSTGHHTLRHWNDCDYLSIISLTPVEQLAIAQAVYTLPAQNFEYPRAFISNEFINPETRVQVSLEKGIIMAIWVKEAA